VQRFAERLKRLVFGSPVATDSARPETLRTRLALAVFGASILSAVAYGPDALIDALGSGGQRGAIPFMAAGVVVIMALLGAAYASQVRAFPNERGDYGVVRDKLGPKWGVITGASLLTDYVFTVAVSLAALTEVIVFVFPDTAPWSRAVAIGALAIMTLASLRGIRDRVRVLVTVWNGFLVVVAAIVVLGVLRHDDDALSPVQPERPETWAVLVAYAGAVASGAVMATGIEHLASAGPHHAEPRGKRASRTLLIAVSASAAAFLGVAILAWVYGVSGFTSGPIVLQVADRVIYNDIWVWVVAASVGAILYAAASAVFRRFSRITSLLAADNYLPRQLAMRNDRLVLRGGILIVAVTSGLLLLASGADIERLVHMYIVGVFTSMVLGQIAMIRWASNKIALATDARELWALHGRRALHIAAGAAAVAVLAVTAIFNFANGAWIALAAIAALVVLMHGISRHYAQVRADLAVPADGHATALPSATHGVVLVAQLHRPALRALAYAKAARHSTLKAVSVQVDRGATAALEKRWTQLDVGVPLVVLDSPYRDLVGPVLDYVKNLQLASPRDVVIVYVPEYIVGRWWEQLLHNRSTARLRAQLLQVPNVVVSAVPWKLESARSAPQPLTDAADMALAPDPSR
jgi:hypothetical protein